MLYSNPRLATPRGRQWCRDCRPDHLCPKHPFDPDFDRWSHNPRSWDDATMDAVHEQAEVEDEARETARWYEDYEARPEVPMGAEADCKSEWDGFACTLDAGHGGFHAAHGSDELRPIATWPIEAPEVTQCPCEDCSGEEEEDLAPPDCAGCMGGCCDDAWGDIEDDEEDPQWVIFFVRRP